MLQEQAARYHVPFVVNDSNEVALGVTPTASTWARRHRGERCALLIGPDKILGISANTVELAVAAEAGADYIGVGAVFGTTTRRTPRHLTVETLNAICQRREHRWWPSAASTVLQLKGNAAWTVLAVVKTGDTALRGTGGELTPWINALRRHGRHRTHALLGAHGQGLA